MFFWKKIHKFQKKGTATEFLSCGSFFSLQFLYRVPDALQRQPQRGRRSLENGRKEYNDGVREYEDGVAELDSKTADAEAELDDARQELADLKAPELYVLDRSANTSYSSFESDSQIVERLATVFPVFFFLIAALGCGSAWWARSTWRRRR